MNDTSESYETLARFMAGESDEAEAARVRAWIARDRERARLLAFVEPSLARLREHPPAALDVEAALERVQRRIAAETLLSDVERARARKPRRIQPWTAAIVALAALFILVVGGFAMFREITRDIPPGYSVRFATPVGRNQRYTLRDGSSVLLGPVSNLKTAGDRTRDVQVTGLAMFNIQNRRQPFVVRAGTAVIEDRGTAFLVRTDDAGNVEVSVTGGSATLRSATDATDPGITLMRGQRGAVFHGQHAVLLAGAPDDADTGWTYGSLSFKDATIERVRGDLRRWFGVQLVVRDSTVFARRITVSLGQQQLDEVLRSLSVVMRVPVTRDGLTVFIGE